MEEGLEALALRRRKATWTLSEWSDWREDLERCLDRERRLQQVAEALARVEKAGAVLAETDVAMATLQAAMAIRSADVATAADEVANLEREVGGLETQTALLARIRDLEEERDRLQEGSPVPFAAPPSIPMPQAGCRSRERQRSPGGGQGPDETWRGKRLASLSGIRSRPQPRRSIRSGTQGTTGRPGGRGGFLSRGCWNSGLPQKGTAPLRFRDQGPGGDPGREGACGWDPGSGGGVAEQEGGPGQLGEDRLARKEADV